MLNILQNKLVLERYVLQLYYTFFYKNIKINTILCEF